MLTVFSPSGNRSYTMYIMYSPYYRTPRIYLSGYLPSGQPLPPHLMMDDIVGDYKDKTVTIEDFPFFAHSTKMASVHPCKHAPVMKVLLDRADGALKRRREKMAGASSSAAGGVSGLEGLVDSTQKLGLGDKKTNTASPASGAGSGDEWEEVQADLDDGEVAIRVDQYLVVFLKVSLLSLSLSFLYFLSSTSTNLADVSSSLLVSRPALNTTSR